MRLSIVVWSCTLLYITYLFINLFDMPSMYYAERFAGSGLAIMLLINISLTIWLLVMAYTYPDSKQKLLWKSALLLSNIATGYIYVEILSSYIKY